MPIEYHVSDDGLRIETFPTGVVGVAEAIDYFNRLKQDNRIKPGATEIVNFQGVDDFKISFLEGQKLTENYQELMSQNIIQATTFICDSDLAFGIARMFQIFLEMMNPDHTVIVTRSANT